MEIDLDARTSNFVTVPAGRYLCRVAEVRPGTTRAGDERWSLRLVVAEGPEVGKQAAWDSLVFSTRGRMRARTVFGAFGLPASGKVQIEPSDLEGRQALVEVRPATYRSPDGNAVIRNEVPYDGYYPVPYTPGEPGAFAVGVRVRNGARGKDRSCALKIQPGMNSAYPPKLHLCGTDGKTTSVSFPDIETARQIAQELLRVTNPINLGQ